MNRLGCKAVIDDEQLGSLGGKRFEDQQATFNALAARANYLAPDRTDIQYGVRQLAIKVSNPTGGDWNNLKRLGRY